MFNIVHADTPQRRLAASVYRGRPGITPGSAIADLCALGKTICLCGMCRSKFNPAGYNYIQARRPPIRDGAIGTCDGCRTKMAECLIFVPLSHADAQGMEQCA